MNPFRRFLSLAFNQFAASPTAIAIGLGANVSAQAIGKGEWFKLTPYVDGDYWEMEKGQWKKYRQVVTKEHADRMVTAFNTLADKQGVDFRGLPIYAGHPDADPQRWPDERRLGGVMALEAREDGIYVKCAWNDLGEKNRDEGYLVYPSPAWPYDLKLRAQTGRIEPIELRSIGMTNTPRIDGVPAWTNSNPTPNPTEIDTTMHKNLLCKILGLPETSTDDDITKGGEALMSKIKTDAASNVATLDDEKKKTLAACSERDAALNDSEKFRKLAINAKTKAAVAARKITAAEIPAWEAKLATNFDAGAQELDSRAAVLPNESLNLNQRTGDLSTPAGRRVAFNTRIDELMAPIATGGKGLNYNAAINAMRANPNDAALLEAMNQASEQKKA